jgi:hypothetical protein
MQTRTPRALVAAAALALFAGACTDTPTTTPSARAPGGRPSFSTSSSGAALVSSAVKYRDQGGKPARGRSGVAELVALARLDREGVTRLSFGAQHAEHGWSGTMTRAQLKASSPDGRHKFTRNLTEPDPMYGSGPHAGIRGYLEMRGLGGGDELRLQANVVGLDPHRVDVVSVTERVKRIPDLAVRMTAPAEAMTGTPVALLAAVREINGDLGTHAVCELLVGGMVVDWGGPAWVDAGDVVTCAMSWTPTVAGTYPVQIRVATSYDAEWDTGNNTDTATIQVHGDGPGFTTMASFYQTTQRDSVVRYERWRSGPYNGEYRDETVDDRTDQSASFWGVMPARMTGTIDVRASMSTGGASADQLEFTHVADDQEWSWCTLQWSFRGMFRMCSGGFLAYPWTEFAYTFAAGAVTYHSQSFSRTWDDLSGTESVYHWNNGFSYDATIQPAGDWTFDVRMNEHVLQRPLQLVRSDPWTFSYPWYCNTWEEPEWDYSTTDCSGSTHSGYEISAFAED